MYVYNLGFHNEYELPVAIFKSQSRLFKSQFLQFEFFAAFTVLYYNAADIRTYCRLLPDNEFGK